MNPLILVGFAAFFIVALIVGVRLLLLWHRTRQLPELLMAIGVLGIGPVGFGCMLTGVLSSSNPGFANTSFALGTIASVSGVLAKCVFNWTVYRRSSIFAMTATVAITGVLLGLLGLHFVTGQWAPTGAMAWDSLARSATQVGCLLWGSTESMLYWSKMKKRQRLGMADAVIVDRFLMWGLGAGFAGFGTGLGVVAEIILGVPSLQIPWVVSTSSFFGFAAAVAIYLAFVPPARYVAYIRSRART